MKTLAQQISPTYRSRISPGKLYAAYALFVLMLVYFFNIIDRQILAILAEDIKSDLDISDSQMGFLFGTVFAIFYSIFGMPLGKLSDIGVRKNVIAAGLGFWSLMTALSGLARGFLPLSLCRMGVGVGEASASPAVYSLLSDYFSAKVRATVISIYSSGVYIGSGAGLYLGGYVVEKWRDLYPDPSLAPFGFAGWQVAFMVVGLPGLILALWVYTLREPVRGLNEGVVVEQNVRPLKEFFVQLQSIVVPFTLWGLYHNGASKKVILTNIAVGLAFAATAWLLIAILGSDHIAQWVSVAVGSYGAFSWVQVLKLRDYPTYGMIFKCPPLMYTIFGYATISFVTTAFSLWAPAFFIRTYALPVDQVGQYLGLSIMVGGWLGVNAGGMLSDHLKSRFPSGRMMIGLIVIALQTPLSIGMLLTGNEKLAYLLYFLLMFVSAMWVASGPAIITDLVMPRMRAVGSAFFIFMNGLIGYAFGPYCIGLASDLLQPVFGSDALRYCLIGSLAIGVPGIFLFLRGMGLIGAAEQSRLQRAKALGEKL